MIFDVIKDNPVFEMKANKRGIPKMVTDAALAVPDSIYQGDRETRFILHLTQDESHTLAVVVSASCADRYTLMGKPITAYVDGNDNQRKKKEVL